MPIHSCDAHSPGLVDILRREGYGGSFTTEVRVADFSRDDPLTLPRLDTNDLPKRADAAPNDWTARAGTGESQR
jgi:hypothetical protein